MFKIICVTDRKSCKEDFLTRIEKIAAAKPDRVIFREKELIGDEYSLFAEKAFNVCNKYCVPFSVHSYTAIAEDLNISDIHYPMMIIRSFSTYIRYRFGTVGASVHSADEAIEAEKLGADYIIAGHIFETSCKPDSAPRGLEFLRRVCESVKIPVYAIGGINSGNINHIVQAGADGACIMSGFMTCDDPAEYIKQLRKEVAEK